MYEISHWTGGADWTVLFLFAETIWPSRPFKSSQMRQKIYVVPVKDIYHVNLTFPMEDLLDYYLAAPHVYLAQIIGKTISWKK